MSYKIFTRGNYFYIVDNDNNREYNAFSKDVLVTRGTTAQDDFFIENIPNWDGVGEPLDISVIQDENGDAYSLNAFITFYEDSTGKSSPGGGATGSPGGSNKSLQYNDNGAFGGDASIGVVVDHTPDANNPFNNSIRLDNQSSTDAIGIIIDEWNGATKFLLGFVQSQNIGILDIVDANLKISNNVVSNTGNKRDIEIETISNDNGDGGDFRVKLGNGDVSGSFEITVGGQPLFSLTEETYQSILAGCILADDGSATGHMIGSSLYYDDTTGFVGVGVQAPGEVLDVNGNVQADNFIGSAEQLTKNVGSALVGEPTGSDQVVNMVSLTQAEYDAGTPVATTFYVITDA